MMDGSSTTDGPSASYALITVSGGLIFRLGTPRAVQAALTAETGGPGETGIEYLRGLYPLALRNFVPYARDLRRMNKVANGMYWELSGPPPNEDPESAMRYTPNDRIIKTRGQVAIISRSADNVISEDHRAVLEETHARVVAQLTARGWL